MNPSDKRRRVITEPKSVFYYTSRKPR